MHTLSSPHHHANDLPLPPFSHLVLHPQGKFDSADWVRSVIPTYLAPIIGQKEAEEATEKLRLRMEREADPASAPDDDDEGEDLCDCEFSLAYGGKILLNQARLHLKKGHRYGLVGPNGCGKSTLMRAIANGQVEGFPPKEGWYLSSSWHRVHGVEVLLVPLPHPISAARHR